MLLAQMRSSIIICYLVIPETEMRLWHQDMHFTLTIPGKNLSYISQVLPPPGLRHLGGKLFSRGKFLRFWKYPIPYIALRGRKLFWACFVGCYFWQQLWIETSLKGLLNAVRAPLFRSRGLYTNILPIFIIATFLGANIEFKSSACPAAS